MNKTTIATFIIFIALAMISALPSIALGKDSVPTQEEPQEGLQEEPTFLESCSNIGDLADLIFDGRQAGVSLTQVLSIVLRGNVAEEILQTIVVYIYEQPRYRSSTMVLQQKIDIRNDIEMWCIGFFL